MVSSSIGEKPQVAPYSGDMLPSVARSAMVRFDEAGTEELDEFSDHAALAQHLRDCEHQIRCRHAFFQSADELEADHFRQHHRERLTEHRRFRLDAADAPAEHGEAVHHCRVRVGADQCVGIGNLHGCLLAVDLHLVLAAPHDPRQIFQIDLMADAGARGHHAEIIERALRPFQEFVAFLVLPIFFLDVLLECLIVAEERHCDRMVDDEIDRHLRIDLLGIAAERLHRVAHSCKIDHRRHAGEVLHQDARRPKCNFELGRLGLEPFGDGLDVIFGDSRPSSLRSRFSSRTFIENGRREMPLSPFRSAVGRLK